MQTSELTSFGALVPKWRTLRREKVAAKLPAKSWAAENHAANAASRATQLRRLAVRGEQCDQKRKTDDPDIPRKRGKTGGTRRKPEDGNEADRENDLRGRGCGAGGRAEGGGGRGSEVPRRGFPK